MAEASPTTTPEPYTASNNASETLQAQHAMTNDAPTDVNNNASLGRLQAQCTARIGEEFAAAAARRTIIADKSLG
jgi:hypothetical protein